MCILKENVTTYDPGRVLWVLEPSRIVRESARPRPSLTGPAQMPCQAQVIASNGKKCYFVVYTKSLLLLYLTTYHIIQLIFIL